MDHRQIEELYNRYLIPVYNRNGIFVARARGSWVWDNQGRRYLDFFPGWGVAALGHCHPQVILATVRQLKKLIHVPNTFYHEPQAKLAEALVKASFPGKVFFTNSGAESVEAAIKLARYWGRPRRHEIITMTGSFHGRTMGALAATGQAKYSEGFGPKLAGFRHVPFNRIEAVQQAIRKETVAVMVEPVQGEGGIHVADASFLKALGRLCSRKNLLFILDEVSTSMGRTGTLFAFQRYGTVPDILLLAKPVGGGLPMGAMIAHRRIADTWKKSSHATTFGGHPVMMAAGYAALQAIRREGILVNVKRQSRYLLGELQALKKRSPVIREVRGVGLMIGLELMQPGAPVVTEAAKRGLLINCTQEKVLRLYPALNIKRSEVELGLERLEAALRAVQ